MEWNTRHDVSRDDAVPDGGASGKATGGCPDVSTRGMIPEEGFTRGQEFVEKYFPGLAGQPILETRACHYESSVDRNFIVDVHPGWENAWITGGGSAEAFKQAPVLGDYIAHRLVGEDMDPEVTPGFRLDEDEFEEDEEEKKGP